MRSQRQHPFSSSSSSSSPQRPPPPSSLSSSISSTLVPSLYMVCVRSARGMVPGSSLPVWWRRAEEERPGPAGKDHLEDPAGRAPDLAVVRARRAGANQRGEREGERKSERRGKKKRSINNLLFVCFCFSCEGCTVVAVVADRNTIMVVNLFSKMFFVCVKYKNWGIVSVCPPLPGRRVSDFNRADHQYFWFLHAPAYTWA